MAATILTLPDLGFESFVLDLVETKDVARMEGRRTEAASFGHAYWRATASTMDFDSALFDEAETFIALAMRAGTYVACHDPYRERPRAYGSTPLSGTAAGTGDPFDGAATIYSLSNRSQPRIIHVPANFQANKGALIEFRESETQRSLHRITANVDFGASGNNLVPLTPPVPAGFTGGEGKARFERPTTLMHLVSHTPRREWFNRGLALEMVEAFPS